MKKKDISRLLQRYLTGHQEGKDGNASRMSTTRTMTVRSL